MTTEQQPADQALIVGPCQTCNGRGWIGGPSYREPDEGGVQCPDCNAIDQHTKPADQGRGVGEDVVAELNNFAGRISGWSVLHSRELEQIAMRVAAAIAALSQPKETEAQRMRRMVGDPRVGVEVKTQLPGSLPRQSEAVVWQSRYNSIEGGWSAWRDITKAEFDSITEAIKHGACSQVRALYTTPQPAQGDE